MVDVDGIIGYDCGVGCVLIHRYTGRAELNLLGGIDIEGWYQELSAVSEFA
jgi:hypothetical protein